MMRWIAGAVVLLGLAAPSARAEADKPLDTKITAVTVYADRAQVTREGKVELKTSGQELVIEGLPGWIDQESVRVTLGKESKGRILDVAVEKTFLAKATDQSVRDAEAAVQEVVDQLGELDDERQVLDAEIKHLESIRAFSLQKLPRDMAVRKMKLEEYGATIDFVTRRLRTVRKDLRGVDKKRRDLQPELARRTRARDELRTRAKLQKSKVTVALEGKGRTTLTVTYLTPGASWEPVGELRTGGGDRASLVQYASVIQTTGEDWSGAKLAFATQRPHQTLEVPAAKALLLGGNGAGMNEVLSRMDDSFNKASSTYEAQNRIFSQGNAAWSANVARQRSVQARAIASFQKLQKRGTTAHFDARSDRTVRADGKAVRVPIASTSFAVTSRVVAVPEVSLNAVRTAELVNAAEQPILPGKVALFVEGAFVGNTELDFVAPGETFSVFLGVHDRVKLARELDRKRSKIERGKKRTELKVSFLLSAENLSDQPVTLDLADRVPVSQDDDIELDDLILPKGAKRAGDGIVRWKVTIPPRSKKTFRIQYDLEYPTGLAERTRNDRKQRPGKARQAIDQIESLESLF